MSLQSKIEHFERSMAFQRAAPLKAMDAKLGATVYQPIHS